MRWLAALLGFVSLCGCASTPNPHEPVVRVSGDEAHVRLGKNTVAVGDEVLFRRKYCEPTSDSRGAACWMRVVGRARVTRLESDQYSIVRVYEGSYADGDVAEPAR